MKHVPKYTTCRFESYPPHIGGGGGTGRRNGYSVLWDPNFNLLPAKLSIGGHHQIDRESPFVKGGGSSPPHRFLVVVA